LYPSSSETSKHSLLDMKRFCSWLSSLLLNWSTELTGAFRWRKRRTCVRHWRATRLKPYDAAPSPVKIPSLGLVGCCKFSLQVISCTCMYIEAMRKRRRAISSPILNFTMMVWDGTFHWIFPMHLIAFRDRITTNKAARALRVDQAG
jgi:hypothetical protein